MERNKFCDGDDAISAINYMTDFQNKFKSIELEDNFAYNYDY